MSERTPSKGNGSSKKRKNSPLKKSASKSFAGVDSANMNESRVEIDHLQTTILKLSQRVEVIEDMEGEVRATRGALENSDS